VRATLLIVAASLALGSVGPAALALNIELVPDLTDSVNPDHDPDWVKLTALLQYVASVYEDIIEDDHTFELRYRYGTDFPFANGVYTTLDVDDKGRDTLGRIRIKPRPENDPEKVFYYDPTPAEDSEYDMRQWLYRDLDMDQQAERFADNVPALFEAGYRGDVRSDAPANAKNGTDLLTILFHEVGHGLGLSGNSDTNLPLRTQDGLFNVDPDFVRGADMAVRVRAMDDLNERAHVFGSNPENFAIMSFNSAKARRRPSPTDIFAMASNHDWEELDLRRQDFLGGVNWHTASNWMGNQVPGAADAAFVRSGGGVNVNGNDVVRSLLVGEGTLLIVGDSKLTVFENMTIDQGDQGDTFARVRIGADGQLTAGRLDLLTGGTVEVLGGTVEAERISLVSGATLKGHGTVDLDGALPKLDNRGLVQATDGKTLTFTSSDTIAVDLDGVGATTGRLEAIDGTLWFETGLTDAFDGTARVGAGRKLIFANGWQLGVGGDLHLTGSGASVASVEATIQEIDGDVSVEGRGRIAALTKTTFNPAADVFLTPLAVLNVDGPTDINGGDFFLGEKGIVLLNGLTTVGGGNFSVGENSRLVVNGPTTVEGAATFFGAGTMVQNGALTIAVNTTVDVDVYDWDGDAGGGSTTTVQAGATLTINAKKIEPGGVFDGHDGTIDLAGGNLAVNTTAQWGIDGTLKLTELFTQNGLFTPSVIGSKIVAAGGIFVSGRGRISADMSFQPSASVVVTAPSDMLELAGDVTFGGGAYVGAGTIRQNADATVLANTTVNVGTYDLDGQFGSSDTLVPTGAKFTLDVGHIETADTDVFNGTLAIGGELAVHNDENLWTMAGQLNFDDGVVSGAKVEITGTVAGEGTFATDADNMGLISPGDSPGLLWVQGHYRQGGPGVLDMEIGGPDPVDDHDQLRIGGQGQFDGILNIIFIGEFAPKAGEAFELIVVDGLGEGDFRGVNIVNLEADFQYTARFTGNAYVLTARTDGVFVPEPATFAFLALGGVAVIHKKRHK